jgi:hypothetical protein
MPAPWDRSAAPATPRRPTARRRRAGTRCAPGACGWPLAAGRQRDQRLGLRAGQHQQRLACEGIEGDQCRHRVARQREQPGRPPIGPRSGPKAKGRPGRMATFQKATSPISASSVACVVGVAHADAAAGQHRVGFGHRALARWRAAPPGRRAPGPGRAPRRPGAAARRSGCSGCCRRCSPASSGWPGARISLPVENSATRRRRARPPSRSPARPPAPGRPGAARGRRAARRGHAPGPRRGGGGSRRADDTGRDRHLRAVGAAQLLRHHGVAARGHHRAGHDAQALPGGHRRRRRACRHRRCPPTAASGPSARSAAPAKA